MLRMKFAAAALALCAASIAHARPAYGDGEAPDTKTTTAAVGPVYVFGTHNTKMTVLALDTNSASLCSPNLANCRPAYGLDALRRGQQFAVAQLLRWDRSGIFAIDTTEIIACFEYFDSPGSANFTCQTAPRGGMNGYELAQAATALGWRTYTGAGLAPLSADRANAFYAKRQRVTAYAVANGTLAPEKMTAMATEDESAPTTTGNDPPPPPDYELHEVVVIGNRQAESPLPPPPPPTVTLPPNVQLVPVGTTAPHDREIVLNPCVTFQVCAAPPPPPPPEFPKNPPKVCTPQCNEQGSIMQSTCSATAGQLATTFGILAPTAGVVAAVVGDPLFGLVVFRSIGIIGAGTTAAYATACLGLNEGYKQQCLIQAKNNGC
jgi:hypothetical protein